LRERERDREREREVNNSLLWKREREQIGQSLTGEKERYRA